MKMCRHLRAGILLIVATACIIVLLPSSSLAQAITTAGLIKRSANLRSGPGTNYDIVGHAKQGQQVVIINYIGEHDWYQLDTGEWIAAFLVEVKSIDETAATTVLQGKSAQVTQIIDGDTIDVVIDGVPYRVRYILIDAPEQGSPLYQEAIEANRKLVDGKTVYLVQDVSDTDGYGWLLRYVYLADGTFVNAELVRQGYAKLAPFPPDVAKLAEISAIQQEAISITRGLWANETIANVQLGSTANRSANLRAGPSIDYPIAGHVTTGQALSIVAQNGAGDWFQLSDGTWIAAFLVDNEPTGLTVEGATVTRQAQLPNKLMQMLQSASFYIQSLLWEFAGLCANRPSIVTCTTFPLVMIIIGIITGGVLNWLLRKMFAWVGVDLRVPQRASVIWFFIWAIFGPAGLAVALVGSPIVFFIVLFYSFRNRKQYLNDQPPPFTYVPHTTNNTFSVTNENTPTLYDSSRYEAALTYHEPTHEEEELFRDIHKRYPNRRDIENENWADMKEEHRKLFPEEWEESSSAWSWGKTFTHKDSDDDKDTNKSIWSW